MGDTVVIANFKRLYMKYLIVIFGIFITMTNYCLAQSEVENIATEICTTLKDVNLNKELESVNKKSQEIIQETYLRKQDLIKTLIIEYSKTNKDKSDVEILKIIGRDITFYLMKDCEIYQRITMFKNEIVPKISSTTEKTGTDFTEFLTHKIKTETITRSIVDDCMTKAMDKNEKELVKNFGSKYSLAFTKEFQAYLLTKCEPYMKWTASLIN